MDKKSLNFVQPYAEMQRRWRHDKETYFCWAVRCGHKLYIVIQVLTRQGIYNAELIDYPDITYACLRFFPKKPNVDGCGPIKNMVKFF